MPVNVGILDGQKTVMDQIQLQEAFNLKKALAIQEAQRNALETQALQAQAANGGLTLKDVLNMQFQQQKAQEDRDFQQQNAEANRQARQQDLQDRLAFQRDSLQSNEALRRAQMAQSAELARANLGFRQDTIENKKETADTIKTQGKQDFEDGLANLALRYKNLKDLGGVTSVNNSALSNALASAGTSKLGQGVGSVIGSKAQSERNSIAGEIPLLTQSIKTATGMSAQQMNSNVELQTFLKALGDPKSDYEANIGILKNLSSRFGTGEVARSLGGDSGASLPQPAGQPVSIDPAAARAELERRAAARRAGGQ